MDKITKLKSETYKPGPVLSGPQPSVRLLRGVFSVCFAQLEGQSYRSQAGSVTSAMGTSDALARQFKESEYLNSLQPVTKSLGDFIHLTPPVRSVAGA